MVKIYIKTKKSNWFKSFKLYYSLCKTRSKKVHLIERLRLNNRLEL